MRKYDSPSCEVDLIMQEKSILSTTATAGDDYPITHSDPFHSRAYGLGEEDDYE